MNGKNRCRILKDIRKRIAEENNIEYITSECKYKGDCLGTCPKCESEVRYLESELEKRRRLGYKVTVAGLAVGITLASSGCDIAKHETLEGDLDIASTSFEDSSSESSQTSSSTESWESTMGDIPVDITGETMGEPVESAPSISDPYVDIMGDYAVFDYDLNEIVKLTDEDIFARLSDWNRDFIDFGWKDNICGCYDHTSETTVFMATNGETLQLIYNEVGEVIAVNGKYMVKTDDEQ